LPPSRHDPLVSVACPAYNVEPYLREAIESVLSQTYANWELVVVNNCSTDRTLEIASEYSARDSRIRVCTNQRFVRAIENYNIALRHISPRSKYCKVLAGDDAMYPECLEKMIDVFEQHPGMAIVGAYATTGTSVVWTGLPYSTTVISGRDVCRSLLLGGPYVFGTPSSVLYRSDIVRYREAFYNESNVHADTEVCCEFLEHADFGFVHQVLTYARVRDDSMSAVAQRLNTFAPWGLYLLDNYGAKYLDAVELASRVRTAVEDYYRYLGKQVFLRRDAEFWRFHRRKLADVGRPLSRRKLVVAAAGFVVDAALNPKRTTEALIRTVRGETGRRQHT
jgi:glycosyltransferase involved in cell wall biosynthesis